MHQFLPDGRMGCVSPILPVAMVSQKSLGKEISNSWKQLIDQYLTGRAQLRLAVIILDARRGWMEKDISSLRHWLECHGRPYIVVAAKSDKLKSQKDRHQSMKDLSDGYAG